MKKLDEQNHPWNVPFRRNPFFTGRDDLLSYLHNQLNSNHTAALTQSQALTGLGGIGKTQIAIEYAYRYRETYDAIFWVRAASRDAVVADFVALASLLQLPGQEAQDQTIVIAGVKRWLVDHQEWLLIMDNADDLSLAAEFLPSGGKGCVLLTTRAQATGKVAPAIAVEKMAQDEGTLLLLRRARVLAHDVSFNDAPPAARAQAEAIVQALHGLPLALDQAGAYIEEVGCSLAEYLALYQQRRTDLLKRQSAVSSDYPHTVSSTWSLSFKQVEQSSPAAADLLRLCAFLDPDIIPEAIISAGASALGDALAPVATDLFLLHEAIGVLRKFSLVKRNPEAKVLNIHRLVQAVLKDGMDAQTRQLWAERTVRAVNAAFPEVSFDTWAGCELCLSQAQACLELIDQYQLASPEAARLLHQAGCYLRERGLYRSAESFLKRTLGIRERVLGCEHIETAATLVNLAHLYLLQSKYEQAEALYQQALTIRERVLGNAHPDTVAILDNVALIYSLQGQYGLAETLLQRALGIKEQVLGPDHFNIAETLNNLARLSYLQGQYEQSEALYQQALTIRKQGFGLEHPDTASTLENLALCYVIQEKLAEAESLHQQTLAIRERVLGPNHPDTASSLTNLASLYRIQRQYEQAEPLFQRALAIREQAQGSEHPDFATSLNHLADLYQDQGLYKQALPLYQRSLTIREKKLGSEHPDTVTVLKNYTRLRQKMQQATGATKREEQETANFNRPESTTSAKMPVYLAGLTPREMEVLRLVAQGLTSAQIAGQLTLSLLTVNTHVLYHAICEHDGS